MVIWKHMDIIISSFVKSVSNIMDMVIQLWHEIEMGIESGLFSWDV